MHYGNIVYGQPKNGTFSEKMESVQYQITLLITGVIKDIIQGYFSGKTLQN